MANVLMFGHCHGVHVEMLASGLSRIAGHEFSVLELLEPGTELRGDSGNAAFQSIASERTYADIGEWALLLKAAQLLVGRPSVGHLSLAWTMLEPLVRRRSIREFRQQLPKTLCRYARTALLQARAGAFDLFHLQFMDPSFASSVSRLPRSAPLVLSIWGSDLLRCAGVRSYERQLRLCERASLITVRSRELQEVLLAKFGRQLANKVRIAKFGSPFIGGDREQDTQSFRQKLRERLGVVADGVVVCIGHNGFEENQHLEVLRAIASVREGIRRRLTLVVPLGYGGSQEYRQRIEKAATATGASIRILPAFLQKSEVLELRAGTDIMVHVPISDALSGAMTETIFAGNIVIAGDWLPYGELRRRGIHYLEVSAVGHLAATLSPAVDNLSAEKRLVAKTRHRLKEILDWDVVINGWKTVYDEALEAN